MRSRSAAPEPHAMFYLATTWVELLAARWLEARAAGHATAEVEAEQDQARRAYRKWESKVRRESAHAR